MASPCPGRFKEKTMDTGHENGLLPSDHLVHPINRGVKGKL
jgi:hypothetical protein